MLLATTSETSTGQEADMEILRHFKPVAPVHIDRSVNAFRQRPGFWPRYAEETARQFPSTRRCDVAD